MTITPVDLKASAKVYKPSRSSPIKLPPSDYSNIDLWDIYYRSPEVNFIGRTVARSMGRVSFIPVLKSGKHLYDSLGNTIEGVADDLAKAASESLERIQGPMGGQSQIISAISGALGLIGDTWLLGYFGDPMTAEPSSASDAIEMWVTLPRKSIEIVEAGKGVQHLKVKLDANQRNPHIIEDNYKLLRMWIPKMDNPMESDSWLVPLKNAVLRLEQLYQALAASALSQLNAGIIVVPSDQDPAPTMGETANTTGNSDDKGKVEKPVFSEQLVDAMAEYIQDAGETIDGISRTQPLTVAIDSEVRQIEWIEIARQIDPGMSTAIDDLRYQIAIGSPFPAEQLLGANQAKFYQGVHNVQRIDQDTFRHIYDPLCQIIAEAFTRYILHEDLSENFSEEEYSQIVVGWDNSKLVAPPDNCEKALQLIKEKAISIEELRLACGWDVAITGTLEQDPIAQDPTIKASATIEDLEQQSLEIDEQYREKLGLLADSAIYRMCEKAGARLSSAANKPIYKALKEEFKLVEPSQIGKLAQVREFAKTVEETNETMFAKCLDGFYIQFSTLTDATYHEVLTQDAWEFLSGAIILEAEKEFFGLDREPSGSKAHSISLEILNETINRLKVETI